MYIASEHLQVTLGGGVSQLSYHILDPTTPFYVEGLEFIPIEVEVQIYFFHLLIGSMVRLHFLDFDFPTLFTSLV